MVCAERPVCSRRGFSLIELVVVMMVLAIVSGLVVAIVGWVRRSANYASIANNQGTLMANFELFRTTFGNNAYPDRFDSLLKASDKTPPSYMHSELVAMITPGTLAADELACLNRGTFVVMDHTDTLAGVIEGNPGNTGTTPRPLATDSTVAFVNPTSTNGAQLVAALYPAGIPADVRLVLFGVGPSNTAIGKTMQSPPFDTNVDTARQYNRLITVFAVYNPRAGRRMQLKALLCSRGRLQNRNLSEFWQSTNPD